MIISDSQLTAAMEAAVDANHRRARARAAAEPVSSELDQSRLSRRALNVLGGVLWTAVMALAVAACIIYAAA